MNGGALASALLAGAAAWVLLRTPRGRTPAPLAPAGWLPSAGPPARDPGASPSPYRPSRPGLFGRDRFLAGAGRPGPAGDRRGPAVGVVLLAALALVTGGVVAAALLAAGGVTGLRALRAAQRTRTVRAAETGVREACSAAAAALRAGRPAADALEAAASGAGPAGPALRRAAAAARLGVPVEGVLRGAAVEEGGRVLGQVAAAWEVAGAHGTGLAAVLDRLGAALGRQAAQREEVEAQLAGSRTAARVLALLPVAGVGLAALAGADPLHVLLRTPVGLGCLLGAVVLDAAGLAWTSWLVRRAAEA